MVYTRNVYNIFAEKSGSDVIFLRRRCESEDNIKIYVKEIACEVIVGTDTELDSVEDYDEPC
jgi:hypothetical protein